MFAQRRYLVLTLAAGLFFARTALAAGADHLAAGGRLAPGEKLTSPNGRYVLIMQADGNLVLYLDEHPLWSSGTCGADGASCVLQGDGNLVVYGKAVDGRTALWHAGTHGHPGARLVCQNDGNVVIYHDSEPLWATHTTDQAAPLLKIVVGFELVLGAHEELKNPSKSRPDPKAQPKPRPKPPAPKVAPAGRAASSGSRLLRAGKWLVRIGGKAVPVLGWGLLAVEGGQWLYGQFAGDEGPDPKLGEIQVNRDEPGECEAVTPIAAGDDTVGLLFHTGFLCADIGAGQVRANRTMLGAWETFRVTRHEDGTVSFLALSTGKYLSAESGSGAGLTADATAVGPSEKFTPVVKDDTLYLKAANGQYVSARPRP